VNMEMNITAIIAHTIHRLEFDFKHGVPETVFCLRLQVESTPLDHTNRATLCLRTPATTPIGFMKPT
jgi:hypothetical protein